MLSSYKIFTFSQHLNKFYYRKFQYIHLTHPKIKIKILSKGRKWDRREKEWLIEGKRDRSVAARKRSELCGGRRRPDRVGLGLEWSGLVVSGSQIGDVEQEEQQDWCVENELGLGWIRLGWWRPRWRCQWASSGDYGCDLAGAGVRQDQCDLGLRSVLGATRLVLLVRSPCCFFLNLFYFPGVEIIWR